MSAIDGTEAKAAGDAAFRAGNFAEAVRHYEIAVADITTPIECRAAAHSNCAEAHLRLLDYPAALRNAQTALVVDIGNVKALHRAVRAATGGNMRLSDGQRRFLEAAIRTALVAHAEGPLHDVLVECTQQLRALNDAADAAAATAAALTASAPPPPEPASAAAAASQPPSTLASTVPAARYPPRVKPPIELGDLPRGTCKAMAYRPSADGVDQNLLVCLHGLGDSHERFAAFGAAMALPQTAMLALRAPLDVPMVGGGQWFQSLDASSFEPVPLATAAPGAKARNSSLLRAAAALCDAIAALCRARSHGSGGAAAGPAVAAAAAAAAARDGDAAFAATPTAGVSEWWQPGNVHLFGFGDGGTVCLAAALLQARRQAAGSVTSGFGSVVSVCGGLPQALRVEGETRGTAPATAATAAAAPAAAGHDATVAAPSAVTVTAGSLPTAAAVAAPSASSSSLETPMLLVHCRADGTVTRTVAADAIEQLAAAGYSRASLQAVEWSGPPHMPASAAEARALMVHYGKALSRRLTALEDDPDVIPASA